MARSRKKRIKTSPPNTDYDDDVRSDFEGFPDSQITVAFPETICETCGSLELKPESLTPANQSQLTLFFTGQIAGFTGITLKTEPTSATPPLSETTPATSPLSETCSVTSEVRRHTRKRILPPSCDADLMVPLQELGLMIIHLGLDIYDPKIYTADTMDILPQFKRSTQAKKRKRVNP